MGKALGSETERVVMQRRFAGVLLQLFTLGCLARPDGETGSSEPIAPPLDDRYEALFQGGVPRELNWLLPSS